MKRRDTLIPYSSYKYPPRFNICWKKSEEGVVVFKNIKDRPWKYSRLREAKETSHVNAMFDPL